MREVLGFESQPDSGSPNRGISRPRYMKAALVLPWRTRDSTSVRERLLPSRSFPIHHPSVILTFETVCHTESALNEMYLSPKCKFLSLSLWKSWWYKSHERSCWPTNISKWYFGSMLVYITDISTLFSPEICPFLKYVGGTWSNGALLLHTVREIA
jgi:hypothetical protein